MDYPPDICNADRDGKRSIDFILVHKVSKLVTEETDQKFRNFTESLILLGLELEYETFSTNDDVVFTKVHAPEELASSYSSLFDVELSCQNISSKVNIKPPMSFMSSPLTRPNINDPIYSRAPDSISSSRPKATTSAERIIIVNQILQRSIWGREKYEYGIYRLIKLKIFIDAFPLHDGDYRWTISGPLNDRQLLTLYWGSMNSWKKAQPINLVEKYFGTEYALYFAWMGLYIKHLIPAAILSVVVIAYGIFTMFTQRNEYARQICQSQMVMCPRCHYSQCPMELLSNSCYIANITYLFDNWCAVVFSAVMSLWATIFNEFWHREEAMLQLQWNVKALEYTITLRPEFLEMASKKKYSTLTGKMEPYVPKIEITCRYILTLTSLTLLLFIMVLATFAVMVYRVTLNVVLIKSGSLKILKTKYKEFIASTTGALMSGIFILVFKWFYELIALKLTNMENHRTHHSFSNAYIYKSYALAFVNNYAAVFYIAFFKGKSNTYPGDMDNFHYLGGINTDLCDPTGCIVDLAILLVVIMVLKAVASNFSQILVPKLQKYFKYKMYKVNNKSLIPQWEKDFLLPKTQEFFIVGEYMDMVIQYGFVNFFIMGFPLAPLFALINNIVELRVDSSKVTKSYRRPVPARVTGLGAWFGIMQATAYIGTATNALVIAFTSNFMEQTIWSMINKKNATEYLNQTLSVFDMKDFELLDVPKNIRNNETMLCYYQGKRYPHDHYQKYRRRKDFWQNMGIKFIVVVLFEHIVMLLKGLIAYAIPDVPFSVKKQMVEQERIAKKKEILQKNQDYLNRRKVTEKKLKEKNNKK